VKGDLSPNIIIGVYEIICEFRRDHYNERGIIPIIVIRKLPKNLENCKLIKIIELNK
jgi:hypothetical protein